MQNVKRIDILLKLDRQMIYSENGEIQFSKALSSLMNVAEKLGYLYYSRDRIIELNGKIVKGRIFVSYYLTSFIMSEKALLDALAVLLNRCYDVYKEVNGDVDLNRDKFVNKLIEKNKKYEYLRQEKKWISNVVKWRDIVVHRKSLAIMPQTKKGQDNPSMKELQEMAVKMPIEPFTITDMKSKNNQLQEIVPFCDDWISHIEQITRVLCTYIDEDSTDGRVDFRKI